MAPRTEHRRIVDLEMDVRDLFLEGDVEDLVQDRIVHDAGVPPRSLLFRYIMKTFKTARTYLPRRREGRKDGKIKRI
jgi:hypothetical protein